MDKEELETCAKKHLRRGFRLYDEKHDVHAHVSNGSATVTYRTRRGIPTQTTRFDIEFIGDTCFVNNLSIEPEKQGQGHGRNLYSAVEEIAREKGFKRVEETASGKMSDGRTKTEYLESLGYTRVRRAISGIEDNEDAPWIVEKRLS